MSKISLQVLAMLAEGDSLSGELIGRKLGVSRMAVSKAIKKLSEKGLQISSVPGKGYQLSAPLQLIDKDIIHSALARQNIDICQLEILNEVSSTSDYLLKLAADEGFDRHVCLAESQQSGRGRRQRQWLATPYRNICLSIGWRFNDGMASLSGLGIAAGITIVRILHEAGYSHEIGLKWPNDIVYRGHKLGGLLIDVQGEHDGPCLAVLGLGLNLALSVQDQNNIDQPSISLGQLSDRMVDRCMLAADLVCGLAELFEEYGTSGFSHYYPSWREYDRLYGKQVNVTRGESSFSGIARGIDQSGALLLDEGADPISKFLSGDVSLRPAQ